MKLTYFWNPCVEEIILFECDSNFIPSVGSRILLPPIKDSPVRWDNPHQDYDGEPYTEWFNVMFIDWDYSSGELNIRIELEAQENVRDKGTGPRLDIEDIHDLPLSARARNALHGANIHTVSTLLLYRPNELIQFRMLGESTLREIIDFLAKYNLKLNNN